MTRALSDKIDQTLQPVRLLQADTKKLVRTYNRIVAQDTIKQEHIIQGNSTRTTISLRQYYKDPLNLIFYENQAHINTILFNHLI